MGFNSGFKELKLEQAPSAPRISRLSANKVGKVVNPRHRLHLPPREYS